jgi:hypothetical protein
VSARLIEIGEAVEGISPDRLAEMPHVPWSEIARMRAVGTPRGLSRPISAPPPEDEVWTTS